MRNEKIMEYGIAIAGAVLFFGIIALWIASVSDALA